MPRRKRGGDLASSAAKRRKQKESRRKEKEEEHEARLQNQRTRMSNLRSRRSEERTANKIFEMPLNNAEICKNYRNRKKKDATLKKQLTQGIKSSVNEVLYTPSTSNSRMTLEPLPQPVTTELRVKEEVIENDENERIKIEEALHTELIIKEENDGDSQQENDFCNEETLFEMNSKNDGFCDNVIENERIKIEQQFSDKINERVGQELHSELIVNYENYDEMFNGTETASNNQQIYGLKSTSLGAARKFGHCYWPNKPIIGIRIWGDF
ncbi:vicilin-like seed storage protein At2g18540 [Chrysoperla carnea]|uniref:vicilin-like seed storage protein At2g18540 n=1 Tax=Chrysoperla carnea TaxID=189513 RepID=UPI001D08A946|nr:vicilin-like seed storage protein At2g18540 [Chrysoperla carnea]